MNVFEAEIPQGAKVLYFYLSVNPGVYTQAGLARCIGATAQSVNAYVKTLKAARLLLTEAVPKSRSYLYEVLVPPVS